MPKEEQKETINGVQYDELTLLMDHYTKGTEDMDIRRTRKNGWNESVKSYLNVLPENWPYRSRVRDPRVRTALIEKNGRLLNAKLQGRLVPREGGDNVKAKINNSILDYQWDNADNGGSMIEKVALSDLATRIYGAAFVYVYWDKDKNCNDIKIIDPRDIFFDFSANHTKNCRWIQIREYTTVETLRERGFNVPELKDVQSTNVRSNDYESVIKQSRDLQDKTGDDLSNPTVEVITEWTKETETVFLPDYGVILKKRANPYDHKRIPVAMLRYYPLGDDIYGESEVEPVISLQRAINAVVCGYIDQMNLVIQPPFKAVQGQYRAETIEFAPGALWNVNSQQALEVVQMGSEAISAFNNTYPMLVNAFNTAMGYQSLGVSNTVGRGFDAKTATEVRNLAQQQNSRDQYNQLYLSEFLKDIMMMWVSNNKQYLFDDPSQSYKIIQIVGKAQIKELEQAGLSDMEIPNEAMQTIADTISQNPDSVTPQMLESIMQDVQVPKNAVITNTKPLEFKPKLDKSQTGTAALYIEKSDLEGLYDYIPDVKSMAAGAGEQMQEARRLAYEASSNQQTIGALGQQGKRIKIEEILVDMWEDAGYRDAESLIEDIKQPTIQGNEQAGLNQPGAQASGAIPNASISGYSGVPGGQGQGQVPFAIQAPQNGDVNAPVQ